MKKYLFSTIMCALVAITANAQETKGSKGEDKKKAKIEAKTANMTPEEKAKFEAKLAERQAQWANMTPEQKEAAKEKMKEEREKRKAMTPEERKAAKGEGKMHGKKGG